MGGGGGGWGEWGEKGKGVGGSWELGGGGGSEASDGVDGVGEGVLPASKRSKVYIFICHGMTLEGTGIQRKRTTKQTLACSTLLPSCTKSLRVLATN